MKFVFLTGKFDGIIPMQEDQIFAAFDGIQQSEWRLTTAQMPFMHALGAAGTGEGVRLNVRGVASDDAVRGSRPTR